MIGASRQIVPVLVRVTVIVVALAFGINAGRASDRWFDNQLIDAGKRLFLENCAECHGNEAQGAPDWTKRDAEGFLPPPPLNGSAHAWHHSPDVLKRTIREGGARLGGRMPGFGTRFNEAELEAIIAYFQSKWPDEVYAHWAKANKAAIPHRAGEKTREDTAPNDLLSLLRDTLPGSRIGQPLPTPVDNLLRVRIDDEYAYLTRDGRHILIGSLIDLSSGANLTEMARREDRITAIAAFPSRDMIIYPSTSREVAVLTVFTDSTCPYCIKLHQEIPSLNANGLSVRYIAFPRDGVGGTAFQSMKSVWCDPDRRQAMAVAMGLSAGSLGGGNCDQASAVRAGYALGSSLGVQGTPSIVLEDGRMLPGYVPGSRLRSMVDPAGDRAR